MRVGLIGISYKSSELSLREEIAKVSQRCFGGHSQEAGKMNCVLLSTCNRTELYFSAEDLAEAHTQILQILRSEVQASFEHKLYSYFGEDCFAHLAMVTTGLDSVIIAESEIQRQVKEAYENTLLHRSLPSCMHFMFQKALKIGKQLRSSSSLERSKVSLEGTIFELGTILLDTLKSARILFIGNSEINRKILSFLKRKEIHHLTLCSQGVRSAQELAKSLQLDLLPWEQLALWQQYDVVVCGTNRFDYLIFPEQIKDEASFGCKMVFDLSMPRNADPRLKRHPQINLFNIQELGELIHKKQKRRYWEISAAEEQIRRAAAVQIAIFEQKNRHFFAKTPPSLSKPPCSLTVHGFKEVNLLDGALEEKMEIPVQRP